MTYSPLFLLFLTALVVLPHDGFAQACTGNLGENIFTAGDFGSGTANVVARDPGIAPGFRYQTTPPPNDGFYTITNNSGRWASIFPSWLRIPDNSDDPNGYMMVVNASFQPGLFYTQEVTDLCENTVYQFTADVINLLSRGSNGIRPNLSFLIDDQEFFSSGDVPEDEVWHTYGFSFATAPGQTTVTLSLKNNAPGGIGNDLGLDNISFRACGPEARIDGAERIDLCEDGDPYLLTALIVGDDYNDPALQWQSSPDGQTQWQNIDGANATSLRHTELRSGFYYYRYLLANGASNLANGKCRVVSNVKEIYVVPKRYAVTDTICAGLVATVGDRSYGRSGITVDTLVSSLGCDSIVTLDLTVVADPGLTPDFLTVDPSCSYRTDGTITLAGVAGGAAPYGFRLRDTSRAVGATLGGLGEGDYPYRIADRYGCAAEGIIRLGSPAAFDVDLGEDRRLYLGDRLQLAINATGPVAEYRFTPSDIADIADCPPDCQVVSLLPTADLTVALTATSDRGCIATDSIRVRVLVVRRVYVPNAFTPDGDGNNDRFTLFGATPNVSEIVDLRIFNRWGDEVFAADQLAAGDAAAGWDGNFRSRPAPSGRYTYVARVLFLDGVVIPYAGQVLLLR